MKVSLCLLTRNELGGCKHDIPLIDRSSFDELYAVDGRSTDGTREYLESQGISVYVQPRPSINAAVGYAFETCQTDALVLYHPKGTIDPGYLREFGGRFEQGYDLVVASRVIKGARNEEDSHLIRPRKWFVLLLGATASVLFRREGNIIWDVLHGVRGMTCAAFRSFAIAPAGATIDLEMTTESYLRRIKRVEFPVVEGHRLVGETHFKALPTGWQLLRYLLRKFASQVTGR